MIDTRNDPISGKAGFRAGSVDLHTFLQQLSPADEVVLLAGVADFGPVEVEGGLVGLADLAVDGVHLVTKRSKSVF